MIFVDGKIVRTEFQYDEDNVVIVFTLYAVDYFFFLHSYQNLAD